MDPLKLAEYYRKFGAQLVDFDQAENMARTNYQRALNVIRQNRTRGQRELAASAADRGMVHSGINAQQNLDLAQQYDDATAQQGASLTNRLSNIARKRLELTSAANQMRAIYG